MNLITQPSSQLLTNSRKIKKKVSRTKISEKNSPTTSRDEKSTIETKKNILTPPFTDFSLFKVKLWELIIHDLSTFHNLADYPKKLQEIFNKFDQNDPNFFKIFRDRLYLMKFPDDVPSYEKKIKKMKLIGEKQEKIIERFLKNKFTISNEPAYFQEYNCFMNLISLLKIQFDEFFSAYCSKNEKTNEIKKNLNFDTSIDQKFPSNNFDFSKFFSVLYNQKGQNFDPFFFANPSYPCDLPFLDGGFGGDLNLFNYNNGFNLFNWPYKCNGMENLKKENLENE